MATPDNESLRVSSRLESDYVVHSPFTLADSYKSSDSRNTIFNLQTHRTPTALVGRGGRYTAVEGSWSVRRAGQSLVTDLLPAEFNSAG